MVVALGIGPNGTFAIGAVGEVLGREDELDIRQKMSVRDGGEGTVERAECCATTGCGVGLISEFDNIQLYTCISTESDREALGWIVG